MTPGGMLVALYEYVCAECGAFDVFERMGSAPGSTACPTCGASAKRRFSAPLLSHTPAALSKARAAEEKSRDEPDVVSSVPARPPARPAPASPRLRTLPKW